MDRLIVPSSATHSRLGQLEVLTFLAFEGGVRGVREEQMNLALSCKTLTVTQIDPMADVYGKDPEIDVSES